MASIMGAVAAVKNNAASILDDHTIEQACYKTGYRFRRRILTPIVVIRLFILQVLHDHTACQAVTHLTDLSFSAQAYIQARMRIPLKVFQCVCRTMVQGLLQSTQDKSDAARWFGHRLLRVDGTGVSMPDVPQLNRRFGQPDGVKPGCGFPVAHLLVLVHAGTGLIMDIIASPYRTHDARQLTKLLNHVLPDDVLLGDRAFCSYSYLSLLLQRQAQVVVRAHQRLIVNFKCGRKSYRQLPKKQRVGAPRGRYIKSLGYDDQLVSYLRIDSTCPDWMPLAQWQQLPSELTVRELRYRIRRRGYRTRSVTIVTTLLDSRRYPKGELAKLYHQRWQIETDLRHLKRTLGMHVLRSRTTAGVFKEMLVFVMAYNLVRLVMLRSAEQQGVALERISFLDAARWLCHQARSDQVPNLLINPNRPGRHQPRVIKRAKDEYPRMTKSRKLYKLQMMKKTKVVA